MGGEKHVAASSGAGGPLRASSNTWPPKRGPQTSMLTPTLSGLVQAEASWAPVAGHWGRVGPAVSHPRGGAEAQSTEEVGALAGAGALASLDGPRARP